MMVRHSLGRQWPILILSFLLLLSDVDAHTRHHHAHQKYHHRRVSVESFQTQQQRHEPHVPLAEIVPPLPDLSPRGFVSGEGILVPRELLIRAEEGGQASSSASNDFTCGPSKPCGNGACCGESGWCGYAPKYCGTGCQSNCDAKAECGQYAKVPGQTCPLNVCCSEHGFCGTTSEFCKAGCQSFCDQPKPSAAKGNVQQKVIGYWEAWNENKACEHMEPDEIPVHDLSHLIFAFGFITPDDYKITNMADVRPQLFKDITFLKNKNPDLTIMIALGGWTHNDPGRFQKVFTTMVASSASRKMFIDNLLGFLAEYGFDGVDFDWEYPGAKDRGGTDADGVNYTQFLKELRAAINASGRQYVVTYTAPTSYWYLRHFDLKAMNQYVDWINLMSYDLHGTWDSSNPIGNQILGHTNLTEIDLALDLFWRNDIAPKDIVLGMGFYGRSFKLKDSKCWKPGCEFSGGGDKGKCTNTPGFLSYSEIMDIVSSTGAKPVYDKDANVNYLVYGQNNWISYDDKKSFERKIEFANDHGLGGLMIWAIDLDDGKHSALAAVTGNEISSSNDPLKATSKAKTVAHSTDDPSKCRVTDCGSSCNQAETAVGRVKSKDGSNCGGKEDARWICCPAWTSLTENSCYWDDGDNKVETDCSGKCKPGDIKIIGDSWGWKDGLKDGDYDFRCLRGGKIFCCGAGNLKRYLDVCSWTGCGEACPADKQNVLTVDSGGDIKNKRCDGFVNNGIFASPDSEGKTDDPKTGSSYHRKLCCPQKDSFKNCGWKSGKTCSEQCSDNQITLDLDPQGPGTNHCGFGRQQAFCCDAPGRANQPFIPVSLDKLFPSEYMPPADAQPQFEIVSFGGLAELGSAKPGDSGVAFFLIAGSSTGLSSMSKRDNPGLHFLDCPTNLMDSALEQVHTARVICLDDDVNKCFSVLENGVEGTIVHMPLECGNGTYARAVSLTPSKDQSIEIDLATRNPTSAVYDFTFDYNLNLARRDAGSYSIRMDYSNVKGYWDSVVDSDGVKKKRDLNSIVERFYSSSKSNWFLKFNPLKTENSKALSDLKKTSIDHLVYFNTQMCSTDKGQSGQGIVATIHGDLDAHFYYGFSMIATWAPQGKVNIHQAAGFLHADGTTSATYTVAGIGTLDTSKKLKGDAITKISDKVSLGGHTLFRGWASFVPYKEESVQLKTSNGQGKAVAFNGRLEAKAVAEWGGNNKVMFPTAAGTELRAEPLVVSKNNKMQPVNEDTSTDAQISLGMTTRLGLEIGLKFTKPYEGGVTERMPDMSIIQSVATTWQMSAGDGVCVKTSVSQKHKKTLTNAKYVGWGDNLDAEYESQKKDIGESECFQDTGSSSKKRDDTDEDEKKKEDKRQNNSQQNHYQDGDYRGYINLPELTDMINKEASGSWGKDARAEINCQECGSCVVSVGVNICCGCAWLPPDPEDSFGSMPMPGTSPFKRSSPLIAGYEVDTGISLLADDELHNLEARADGLSMGTKEVTFATDIVISEPYPGYPDFWTFPTSSKDFDASRYTGVKKYFHNSTATCTSFDIAKFATHDEVYMYPKVNSKGFAFVQGTKYHQTYDTEHVLEGQTIARFFTNWLPSLSIPQQATSTWIQRYILTNYNDATLKNTQWAHRIVDELGSVDHQDRLTIFQSRSNGMKGRLFKGAVSMTQAKFRALQPGAEQLLAARQLGMIFPYMNHNDVWASFCDTYNGILDRLEEADAWYKAKTGATSYLAEEWPKYVRADLDLVVERAREDLKMMNQNRHAAGAPYTAFWLVIMNVAAGEIQKVKLERTDLCRNLPASTVGRFTG